MRRPTEGLVRIGGGIWQNSLLFFSAFSNGPLSWPSIFCRVIGTVCVSIECGSGAPIENILQDGVGRRSSKELLKVWYQAMAKSRIAMRREVEAAEAAEADGVKKKSRKSSGDEKAEGGKKKASKGDKKDAAAKKKKVAKPRTKRAKEQMQRRRIVWVVYSSTMREEGRFLYYEKDKAEELLANLLAKGKRRYFMQPLKEALNPDGTPIVQVVAPPPEEEVEEEVKVDAEVEPGDDIDLDVELEIDGEEGEEAAEEGGEAEEAAPEA